MSYSSLILNVIPSHKNKAVHFLRSFKNYPMMQEELWNKMLEHLSPKELIKAAIKECWNRDWWNYWWTLSSTTKNFYFSSLPWLYYLQTNRNCDKAITASCRNELLTSAKQVLAEQQKVAFRCTRRNAGAENTVWGLFQRKEGSELLIRAWQLTHDREYRWGAILSTQMALGANPNNMVYTTGLGRNPMWNALLYDAEVLGHDTPNGNFLMAVDLLKHKKCNDAI